MITAASQFRDWDIALMIFLFAIAMFIPEMIEGVHKYRRGRDLARQITQEHEARKALEKLSR
jgi:hypothetical protein